MYADLTLKDYLQETASSTPVPGGGSVAAAAASMAAALVEMVAGLTIGRKGFRNVDGEMEEIRAAAASARENSVKDIDRDPEAYRQVLEAFRLPKETARNRAARTLAIQKALKGATQVPLALAEEACRIMELAGRAVQSGNPNAVTDGVVAVLMTRSAGLAALYNVRTNLSGLPDGEFVGQTLRKVAELESDLIGREREILAKITF